MQANRYVDDAAAAIEAVFTAAHELVRAERRFRAATRRGRGAKADDAGGTAEDRPQEHEQKGAKK